MSRLMLDFTPSENAVNHRIRWSMDGGANYTEAEGSPSNTSPVVVATDPAPGSYIVELVALGDGTTYTDSAAVTSEPVVVPDVPVGPTPLADPVINSVTFEPNDTVEGGGNEPIDPNAPTV